MAKQDAFINELLAWKLGGAVAWHAVICWLGSIAWFLLALPGSANLRAIASLNALGQSTLLYLTSLALLYTQRRVLSTQDVPPLQVPRLGLGSKSWITLFITRCIIRNRCIPDVLNAGAFYLACFASGCCTCAVFVLATRKGAASWEGNACVLYSQLYRHSKFQSDRLSSS